MRPRILLAVLIASTTAAAGYAGDSEFDRIVKAIESHYGVKPLHIPFMGVASLFVKVARPEGASGVKLAVFEGLQDLKSAGDPAEWRTRDRFMDSLAGPGLHPLVRVHSRRNGEATYIFMGPERKSTRVLIASFERNEATVVEVKANIEELLGSLEEPGHASERLQH